MYSQSGTSSTQLPRNAPWLVQSVSMKSRHDSRMPSSGACSAVSACSATAVDSRSGIGRLGLARNPPSRRCASSQSAR